MMAFQPVTPSPDDHLVVAVWGAPKVGKTHFALTFPQPIAVLNLDFGLNEVVRRAFPKAQIMTSDLIAERPGDVQETQHLFQTFFADYKAALEDPAVKTVVVDTATQVKQMIDMIKLDEVRKRKNRKKGKDEDEDVQFYPYDYTECNALMSDLLRRGLRAQDTNVVFIHHAQAVYGPNGQELNQIKMQGFKNTSSILPLTIQFYDPVKHVGRIEYSRGNDQLTGVEIPGMDYAWLREYYLELPA